MYFAIFVSVCLSVCVCVCALYCACAKSHGCQGHRTKECRAHAVWVSVTVVDKPSLVATIYTARSTALSNTIARDRERNEARIAADQHTGSRKTIKRRYEADLVVQLPYGSHDSREKAGLYY